MKRMPLLASFLLFLLLCMSLTYWALRIFNPKSREVIAPTAVASFEPSVGQWGGIFGRNPVAEAAPSNYQLKGVVVAKENGISSAIVIADGKAPQAIQIGRELAPGVRLQEVHEAYVVISESGAMKRIELPQATPINSGIQAFPTPVPDNRANTYVPPPPESRPNSYVPPAPTPPPSGGQPIISPTGIPVPPQGRPQERR